MKRMMKYVVCTAILMLLALDIFAAVPASPSIVSVNGTQLRVRHRREDNTLKATTNYVIKGVCYSVATNWPVETFPPGAPFENDDRWRTWEMAQYDFPRIKEAGFNTIRLYVDLGLADDASLYFDEDTNGVIWDMSKAEPKAEDDDGDHWEDWLTGMPMIGQLGDQAVTNGLAVLDEAYKNGLKVVAIVDGFCANTPIAQKMINTYKNHPAILMWQLGNEFNYNFNDQKLYMWRYDTFLEACQAVEDIAIWIKNNDSNHPVSACLGEPSVPSYSEYKAGVDAMTNVDMLGINCYRGRSFKDLYKVMVDTIGWSKPFYISEYGVDAWHYDSDVTKEFEDLAGQKEGIAWQWDDLHRNLSAVNANNNLLGGFAFEWVDEWWKFKGKSLQIHDTDPGYPVNANEPPSTDLYPDGCMNEEWWGLNSQNTLSITSMNFYSDAGLLTERITGIQGWDIYTWGLPVGGDGYGKINAQATYVQSGSPDNGLRYTYSPYPEYSYTGGDTIPEGKRCMFTELWSDTYGVGWGIFRTNGYLDLSQYASGNIKFWLKVKKADGSAIGSDESKIFFKFEDVNGPGQATLLWLDDNATKNGGNTYFSEFNANSTGWQEISVPVSALNDNHSFSTEHFTSTATAHLDLTNMKMVFSMTCKPKASGGQNIQWWIDNVRWEMPSGSTIYNRTARPALLDYRAKYNNLSYLKTVFEAGAVSDRGIGNSARLTENYSAIISTWNASGSFILATAINSKTGKVSGSDFFDDASDLGSWILPFMDAGDDYTLSFAKYGDYIGTCSTMTAIGSTHYSGLGNSSSWAFVTRIINGSSVAKKEESGSYDLSAVNLSVPLDVDCDNLINACDTDSDGDGLTDAQELRYGTDPLNTDTDADGYSDATEVANNTNARNPDSKVLASDTQAKLLVKPLSLAFANTEIQAPFGGKERYLYIENDGGEYLSYKVDIAYTDGSGWLAVKYRDHSTNAWTNVTTGSYSYKDLDDYMLQVVVDTTTMTTQQTYDATITVTANDDDGTASGSQVINVSVPISPLLAISRTSIIATKPETTKKFQVKNEGCSTFNWTITKVDPAGATWLTIDPTSGSTGTSASDITLSFDWTNFEADTSTVLKVDAGALGVKYLSASEKDFRFFSSSSTIDNADASFLGRQAFDYRECNGIKTADANNDGCDDMLVGALQYFTANTRGRAYLFFGSPNNLHKNDTVASSTIFMGTGLDDATVYFGTSVALADIDGDGWKDVIVGDKCTNYIGAIYIFFNPMGTVDAQGNRGQWKNLYKASEADIVIGGEAATFWEDFGECITSGDYNNDGYEDLVIGADNQTQAAYLVFGRTRENWNTYKLSNYTWSTLPTVTSVDDVTKFYSSWNSTGGNCGWVLSATTGDYDNDGYDDFVLGASEYPSSRRLFFLVYGRSGKEAQWGSSLDCYNNVGANIIPIIYDYNAPGGVCPMLASGDANGDGCYDVMVSTGGNFAYLLEGSTTKWSAAKYLPQNATTKFNVPLTTLNDVSPWISGFSIVKDMNGDGKDEVALGNAWWYQWNQKLYLYLGRTNMPATVDLDTESDKTFTSEGHNNGTWFLDGTISQIGTGDYNGDGRYDMAALAETDDTGVDCGGQLYIVFGRKMNVSSHEIIIEPNDNSGVFYVLNTALDGVSLDWTASESESWISSVSPASGNGLAAGSNTAVTVNVSRTGLNDGKYEGYVNVTSGSETEKVKVILLVGPREMDPICQASTEHVVILGSSGVVDISNIAPKSTMSWTAATTESWISSISPNNGSISTGSTTLTINVNRSGYATDQTGKVTITYDNGCTKDIYVTMAVPNCRIGSTYYSSIQSAYNAASTGQTIQVQEDTFTENLTFNRAVNVTIAGGYSSDWSTSTGTTSIAGNVTENSSGGKVTFNGTGKVVVQ